MPDSDFEEEMEEESDEGEALEGLDDLEWSEDSDDGEGGHFSLKSGSEVANLITRSHPQPTGLVGGGGASSSKKKLVMDNPEMEEIWQELRPRRRQRKKTNKDGTAKKRRGAKVPPEVERLLGEANSNYAFGELDAARTALLEAIRLSPGYPDSYHTLGLVHQDEGEAGKALECFIIAAHLTGRDFDQWNHLAHLSQQQQNIPQAIYCLNRALRLRNTPEGLYLKAQLLESTGNEKKAVEALTSLLPKLQRQDHGKRTEACASLARLHSRLGDTGAAVKVLEDWVAQREGGLKSPDPGEMDPINMLFECLILQKEHQKGLKHMADLEASNPGMELPVDIVVKKGVFLIGCDRFDDAQAEMQPLFSENFAETADLHFDVAEAYREAAARNNDRELVDKAHKIYDALEAVESFNQPGLWLCQAKCYHMMSAHEQGEDRKRLVDLAVAAYEKVRVRVPGNPAACNALGDLYFEKGEKGLQIELQSTEAGKKRREKSKREPKAKKQKEGKETASKEKDPDGKSAKEPKKAKEAGEGVKERKERLKAEAQQRREAALRAYSILHERAKLKYEMSEWADFLSLAKPLLPCPDTVPKRRAKVRGAVGEGGRPNQQSLLTGVGGGSGRHKGPGRLEGEEERGQEAGEEGDDVMSILERGGVPSAEFMREALGAQEYIEICICAVRAHTQLGQLEDAERLVSECLVFGRFTDDKDAIHVLRLWAVVVTLQSGAYLAAFDSVRYVCNVRPHSVPVWNLFSTVVNNAGNDKNHYKFVLRCLLKNPSSVPCMILMGHHCLMSGTVKLALGEYMRAYKRIPEDPLINLLIANGYLSHIMSRKCVDRSTTCLRAFTFLFQYARLRNWSQEVYYNIGRAMHQLSVYSMAIPCYEQVLLMGPPEGGDGVMDLKREAACNLAMIYRESGSRDLARSLLVTYCTF